MSHLLGVTGRWRSSWFRVPERCSGECDTMASPLNGGDAMIGRETRVLLRHLLEMGMSKAAIARRVGTDRRTVHRWIATGQLDRAG